MPTGNDTLPIVAEQPPVQPSKPIMRGWLHLVYFCLTLPAGIALIVAAPTVPARVGAIVYSLCLAGMFGVSALYHRRTWSERGRRWMKRADHSMIFLLIAGTYTPFSLLVLHGGWRIGMLIALWTAAITGIVLKFVRIDGFHAVSGALYITMGWAAIITFPQMFHGMSGLAVALLLIGGLFYTFGSIVLATKKPNPSPRVFGYHEVWHSMTIAGSACHLAVIFLVVLSLR